MSITDKWQGSARTRKPPWVDLPQRNEHSDRLVDQVSTTRYVGVVLIK